MELPSLPPGWRYAPLKRIAALRFSSVDKHSLPGEVPVRLCNYLHVYRNERITQGLDFMEATASESEVARFSLRPGDVLLTKDSEDPGDIGVPSCVAEQLPGVICGYHLALARPDPNLIEGPFLLRSLQATGIRDQFYARAVGVTRFALGLREVGDALVPVAPLTLQGQIGALLDRKTAAIDQLIQKKKRLIELLQEKRQALITQAVTKGLEPSTPMKESGVDWLGRIPAHWGLYPLRRVLPRIEQGWSPSCESRVADEHEWGVLKAGCTNGGVFREDENKALPSGVTPKPELEIHAEDLLMSRASGSSRLIGSCAYVLSCRPRVLLSDKVFRLHPAGRVQRQYLAVALASRPARHQIEGAISGAEGLANNITQEAVRQLVLPLPPVAEQSLILERLDVETAALGALTERLTRQLEAIAEYRQALISAAVTGQIDVSNEAA